MAFNPITVNKGPSAEPHIYAEDDASIFQCMFGEDGILDIGSKLELSIQSNNLVRMSDGVLCIGGHIGRVKYADYVDLTIDNGETGYNRNDLIIGSFSNTGEHTIDTFEPQVVKGTPATGDAVDPTLTEGSLYEGEHLRQAAVARVRLEGLNIVGIDMLLPVIPSIPSLKAQIDELNGKISAALTPVKVWEGGLLEAGQTYNFQNTISKSGLIMAKVGLTQYERYVTWSTFPATALGDQITWTDYFSDTAFYQVKATLSESGIHINEINRGPNWANSHIYMQIYKQG